MILVHKHIDLPCLAPPSPSPSPRIDASEIETSSTALVIEHSQVTLILTSLNFPCTFRNGLTVGPISRAHLEID